MQATARIFFLKAPAKRTKDGLCPVKLCVTHDRERKYYSIAEIIKNEKWLFLSENDIEKVTGNSPRGKYRDIAFEYSRITDEAIKAINEIKVFSFAQFEEKFFTQKSVWDNFFVAMVSHIKALKDEERFGYASSMESTIRSVKEFHENKKFAYSCRMKVMDRYEKYVAGKPLNFVDITPGWLRKYESYLKKEGKSVSTIGIYCRNIRVLFNLAVEYHGVKAIYPFIKYKPKTATGRKIALNAHQVSLIANYHTNDPREEFYRNMFIFSFLGNGMNLSDIARLRYSNIVDGELCFVRQKTKREETEEDKLRVPLTENMLFIIEKHGNRAIGYDSYIFPVLTESMSEEKKYYITKEFIKQVNANIQKIAPRLGITEKVSSYSARHSWATISKNSGTSIEYIKESLGHSSVAVTERYLSSFEKSTRQEHSKKVEDIIFNNAL